jgi:hypothetical protein
MRWKEDESGTLQIVVTGMLLKAREQNMLKQKTSLANMQVKSSSLDVQYKAVMNMKKEQDCLTPDMKSFDLSRLASHSGSTLIFRRC